MRGCVYRVIKVEDVPERSSAAEKLFPSAFWAADHRESTRVAPGPEISW